MAEEDDSDKEVCKECGDVANRKVEKELRIYARPDEEDPDTDEAWLLHTDEGESVDYYCDVCLGNKPTL